MNHRSSFLTSSQPLEALRKFLPYSLLLSITLALYGTTLYFGFVWDDFAYVLENYRIQGFSASNLRAIWTSPFLDQYAPLHHSLLAALYSFSGLDPFGYHLGQLLLHAACVCLLYFVLKNIESERVALLASVLFAVFPPNIETVAWISETKSTLAFLFFLLSFWFFLRLRLRERWLDGVLCGLFLILSVLTKINTVVAPAIFLFYDYSKGDAIKKARVWTHAGLFFISAVFIGVHLASSQEILGESAGMLADATLPGTHLFNDSGGYFGGANVHLLNVPRFLLFYMRMIVVPHPLSAWHMFRVFGVMNATVGLAWIALLCLLWILYRSPRNIQFWQLWFYVFLLPVLQFIPNSTWVADRYLYIPAVGAFVLCGKFFFYVLDHIHRLWLRLGWEAVMVIALVGFAWLTYNHVPVWRNDWVLWDVTTKTSCMNSAYCHGNLGRALLRNQHPDLALREFFQALQIRPAPLYFLYLGDAYAIGFGDYRQALMAYRMVLQNKNGPPFDVWAKLAKVYYLQGDLENAGGAIEAGRRIYADDPRLLVVNGFLQWKRGNLEQAKRSLLRVPALGRRTANAAALINYYWGNPAEVGRLLADLGSL